MIETNKSSSDMPIVEEFIPPRYKDRSKQLRSLVQIVSFLAIALFFSNAFRALNIDFFNFLSTLLFIGYLLLFLMGIGVSFFHLRYINDRRNKITNLGGTIGLSGLILTGIPCACEMGLEQAIYSLVSSFLPFLLGFGLLLTVVGFFAEATLIDETLIYLIRMNFRSMIRYSVTIIGLFLVNFGLLMVFVWPIDLTGIGITTIGLILVLGTWIDHIFQLIRINHVLILRMSELGMIQVLLLSILIIPIINAPELTFDVFLIVVALSSITILISYADLYFFGLRERFRDLSKRYAPFLQAIVLINIVGLIYVGFTHSYFFGWVGSNLQFFGFYLGVSLLLIYRMWFTTINGIITQSILFLRTYYREIVTLGAVIPMILGAVLLSSTKGDILGDYLIPTLVLLAGYLLAVIVWYFPKHSYSRGVNTSLSSVLLFWSLLEIYNNINLGIYDLNYPINLGLVIPGVLVIFYMGMDTHLWRKELYHAFQQVWAFFRTYYREFVTFIGIGFMAVGPFFFISPNLNPFEFLPVFLFLFGYALIIFIWRIPKHTLYFRGITTTLSVIVFLWGLLSVLIRGRYNFDIVGNLPPEFWPSIVSIFYMVTPSVMSAYLWRMELKRLLNRIVEVALGIIIGTIKYFIDFMKAIWNAFKQVAWGVYQFVITKYREIVTVFSLSSMFIGIEGIVGPDRAVLDIVSVGLFFLGYIVCCVIWRFPNRHSNFRGITTTISIFSFFWGVLLLIWYVKPESNLFEIPFLITFLLLGLGSFQPIYLWRVELWQLVKQIVDLTVQSVKKTIYTLIDFMKAVWYAFKRAFLGILNYVYGVLELLYLNFVKLVHYVRENFWTLVRYAFTFVGFGMITVGLYQATLLDPRGILWILVGVIVICSVWWENTLQVLGAVVHALKSYFVQISMFLRTKFLALIEFVRVNLKNIVKSVTTLVGGFLVLFGLLGSFGFVFGPLHDTGVPPNILIIAGTAILYATWFFQVNEILIRTLRSIRDALVAFGHYIWNKAVSVKNAIMSFFIYVISLWRDIVRATATIIGAFLVIIGFYSLSTPGGNDLMDFGLIFLGMVMISVSWRSQIKEFLVRYGKALLNMTNQIIKTISKIISQIWNQIGQILRSGLDSSLYISVVTLGVVAFGFGLILFISGFTNDQGAWTREILKPIPIIGDILWILASILQGTSNVENLLGFFAELEAYILFFMGIVFVGFGIALPIIFYFIRDSIKISSLRQRSGGLKVKEV